MTFKQMLLAGATAGLMMSCATLAGGSRFISPAQADTDISFSIGGFYDRLSPYGGWTGYGGTQVFIPSDIDDDWQPYSRGRWEYTARYGWLWVSDEPHGWATYHYGRWGHADDLGWYWVPGTRWAPAYVSWESSDDYVGWAPLAPRRDDPDIFFSITIGDQPDYGWVAVPTRRFLEPNLFAFSIRDYDERYRIRRQARRVGNVTIVNNTVVNNFIEVNYVERKTRRKVRVLDVESTGDPSQVGKRRGDKVAIFNPEAKPDPTAKPTKLADLDKAKQRQVRRNKQRQLEQAKAGEPGAVVGKKGSKAPGVEQVGTGGQTAAELRKQRRLKRQAAAKQNATVDETTAAANRKKRRVQQNTGQVVDQEQPVKRKAKRQKPAVDQADPQVQANRKKRRAAGNAAAVEKPTAGSIETVNRRKQKRKQAAAAEAQQATAAQRAKRAKRNQGACDPAVNANCVTP